MPRNRCKVNELNSFTINYINKTMMNTSMRIIFRPMIVYQIKKVESCYYIIYKK